MTKPIGVVAVALLVVIPFSCGGGSGGPGAAFCHDYATTLCHKIYQCPLPNNEPNLLGGKNEADCVNGWTHICADKSPPGQTDDLECSGNVHVNTAARDLCLMEITSATCDDFNSPNFYSVCNQVCTNPSTGAAGSTTGAAGTGTAAGAAGITGAAGTGTITGAAGSTGAAGTGTFPAPADAKGYCDASWPIQCDQVFKCFSADERAIIVSFTGETLAECKGAKRVEACATAAADCPGYSGPLAQACLNKLAAQSCNAVINVGPPVECDLACMQ